MYRSVASITTTADWDRTNKRCEAHQGSAFAGRKQTRTENGGVRVGQRKNRYKYEKTYRKIINSEKTKIGKIRRKRFDCREYGTEKVFLGIGIVCSRLLHFFRKRAACFCGDADRYGRDNGTEYPQRSGDKLSLDGLAVHQ